MGEILGQDGRGFCRDCLKTVTGEERRCTACGSPRLLRHAELATLSIAHIDCDIFDAVAYSQDAVWPQMAKGGYLVYDDADVSSCIGATEAVENLIMERRIHMEQVWPHWIVRTF